MQNTNITVGLSPRSWGRQLNDHFTAFWMKHIYWFLIIFPTFNFVSTQYTERPLFSCNSWHYMALQLKGSQSDMVEWYIISHCCHRLERRKTELLFVLTKIKEKITLKKNKITQWLLKTIFKDFFLISFGWTYAVFYSKVILFHVSLKTLSQVYYFF